MQHAINRKVRLAGPVKRIYCRFFNPANPLGWADYHIVQERRGTLWVHCHGLKRRKGHNLEFVGVPAELRRESVRLMMGIIRMLRGGANFAPDRDLAGRFTSSKQSFAQIGTFRLSPRNDGEHEGMLRIVDYGEPLHSGFPERLFAAHLAARGQAQTDPAKAERIFRRSLELFPGEIASPQDAIEYDAQDGDITALQAKSNLGARLGLGLALRAQGRVADARKVAIETIAHCYEWARLYRDHLVQTDDKHDAYYRFWRDADLLGIATSWQPVITAKPDPPANSTGVRRSGGFGDRTSPIRRV